MSSKFLTGVDANLQKITSVADGTSPNDAVNRGQLDNAIDGRSWKAPVRLASTTSGALATAYASGQSLDGVTLTTGMRILLKDQATASENGIYVVTAGAPTRATDADTTTELQSATVYVIAGTNNADKSFTQTANDPVIGTTGLVWAQVGGGTAYTAGNGLALNGTTFSVSPKAGGGIIVDSSGVAVDSTALALAKRFSADVPAGSTSVAITHGLGTTDVHIQVQDKASGAVVFADMMVTSTNVVTLGFATAPTTGQYRVVIVA